MTFTEKSARELRTRIRDACRNMLRDGGDGDRSRWRTVLRALEAAPIGTFHQYCTGLLRRHALRAGIDPDFQVFDARSLQRSAPRRFRIARAAGSRRRIQT